MGGSGSRGAKTWWIDEDRADAVVANANKSNTPHSRFVLRREIFTTAFVARTGYPHPSPPPLSNLLLMLWAAAAAAEAAVIICVVGRTEGAAKVNAKGQDREKRGLSVYEVCTNAAMQKGTKLWGGSFWKFPHADQI